MTARHFSGFGRVIIDQMAFVTLDPTELAPAERYRILVSAIVPRPIALVSTVSASGQPNLAPFSYFQVGGNSPPSLVFSPTNGPGGLEKDTLRNIRETEEFCVNLVTREMALGMNQTSANVPMEESEWGIAAFNQVTSRSIRPARVAESPVQLECRLFAIVEHGDGPGSANYVIGEVLQIHLREELVGSPESIRPIGRLGGQMYIDTATGELFSMARPSGSPNRQ